MRQASTVIFQNGDDNDESSALLYITRPHTPITQQLCLRLYFDGLPLSLMRVHVKDRPKIGELLQIYDNLLLAHLM